ncbi:hypothetical protein CTI12_AA147690 [Artemisia annua]|uniref:Helitron helicase-like domain-containing protein n=1 Tax=Artemisia annua TaxID=35608 RepID=A0A2U1PIL6_ARTAN|nr:hypothetical protein CTI12_AA147690 [Artemisia annua]
MMNGPDRARIRKWYNGLERAGLKHKGWQKGCATKPTELNVYIKVYIKPSSKRRRFAIFFPAKKLAEVLGPADAYFWPASRGLFVAQKRQRSYPKAAFTKKVEALLKDECNVQGRQASGLANLPSSASFMNKGKGKVTDLCSEDAFGSGGASSPTLSATDDTEFQCGEDISFIDGGEAGVVPEHVPNAFTLCGVGPSSNETSQTSDTVRGNLERNNRRGRSQVAFGSSSDAPRVSPTLCGVGPSSNEISQTSDTVRGNLERNNRRRRSQVTFGSSSDAPRVPPNMRARNRRSRQGMLAVYVRLFHIQNIVTRCAIYKSNAKSGFPMYNAGPPDTYVHMGRCDQVCRHCSAMFWYDERTALPQRNRVDYHKCCNNGKRAGQVLRADIVENLIELLDEHNELVQLFRTARDKIEEADVPEFKIRLFGVVGSRQHELPAGDSIGAIVFEGGPDMETEFDVVVEQHNRQLKSVNKLNASYMSMQFPLLFFFGEDGKMDDSSSVVPSDQSTGKAIVPISDDIGLNNLKETDTGKPVYVKVY